MRKIFAILARVIVGVACLFGCLFGFAIGAVGIKEWLKDPEFFNK